MSGPRVCMTCAFASMIDQLSGAGLTDDNGCVVGLLDTLAMILARQEPADLPAAIERVRDGFEKAMAAAADYNAKQAEGDANGLAAMEVCGHG